MESNQARKKTTQEFLLTRCSPHSSDVEKPLYSPERELGLSTFPIDETEKSTITRGYTCVLLVSVTITTRYKWNRGRRYKKLSLDTQRISFSLSPAPTLCRELSHYLKLSVASSLTQPWLSHSGSSSRSQSWAFSDFIADAWRRNYFVSWWRWLDEAQKISSA